jgi:hypothetical protein
MYEFCYYPSVPFMGPFDVAFDDTGTVVIDILHRLVRKINEWDVVKVPWMIIESG